MKLITKIFLLTGFVSISLFSPILATNEDNKNDSLENSVRATHALESPTEFFFPDFDLSMDSFWTVSGTLIHTCSARSWLGGTSKAICSDKENCTCVSNFFRSDCKCTDP